MCSYNNSLLTLVLYCRSDAETLHLYYIYTALSLLLSKYVYVTHELRVVNERHTDYCNVCSVDKISNRNQSTQGLPYTTVLYTQ